MYTKHLLIVGSAGSGKTFLARTFPILLEKLGKKSHSSICTCIVAINICHFLCFSLLWLLYKLKYTRVSSIIGNYYLTIHFTNKKLFRKIVKIMAFLDMFDIPLLSSLKILLCKIKCMHNNCRVIVFDEYIINALVDYMYFNIVYNFRKIYKLMYLILYSYLARQIIKSDFIIVYTKVPLLASIQVWQKREKTKVVDILQLYERTYATEVLINILKNDKRLSTITVMTIFGNNPSEVFLKTMQIAIKRLNNILKC